MNREAWLTDVAKRIEPLFKGSTFKPYRLTCGWPCVNGLSPRRRRVGECHNITCSRGGVYELFISPVLDDPLEVAGTVTHELAHVLAGTEAAHGKGFVRFCRHVGLTKGRPTEAMPGKDLEGKIKEILTGLPSYPHKALVPTAKPRREPRPRPVKLVCACGCKVTMSADDFAGVGVPTCACRRVFTVKSVTEDE